MESESEGSVTRWTDDLESGGDAAAQELWDRYFERLVRLASKKLLNAHRPRTAEDDADAALRRPGRRLALPGPRPAARGLHA